ILLEDEPGGNAAGSARRSAAGAGICRSWCGAFQALTTGDDSLPVTLLHLRAAEIVRLCGLARAARGQDFARTGRVRQAERVAGTLRAVVLDGETAGAVLAGFSASGLDAWACDGHPLPVQPQEAQPQQAQPHNTSGAGAAAPCEHVAA